MSMRSLSKRDYSSFRRWQQPRERTLAKAKGRRVFLQVGKELWIEADLYDEGYRESKGAMPAELVIACPRCDGALRINGERYPVTVRYFDKPQTIVMPDNGERVQQTVSVSVEGMVRCSYEAPAGKGMCGWKCVIKENRVYR